MQVLKWIELHRKINRVNIHEPLGLSSLNHQPKNIERLDLGLPAQVADVWLSLHVGPEQLE